MKSLTRTAIALAAASMIAVGCDDDTTTAPVTPSEARVRVMHGSPNAPAVDVLVDGQPVLTGVAYPQNSSYLVVPAGARNLQVRVAGTSTVVIDETTTLQANSDYTVIASGLVVSIQAWVLADDNSPPGPGMTKVRLVHNAPSAPEVDIYVTAPGADLNAATPVLTSVPFAAASPYLEVAAGTYQVRICPAGTKTVAIDSGALALAAGQIRTAIAIDAPGGGTPFGAVLLADLN